MKATDKKHSNMWKNDHSLQDSEKIFISDDEYTPNYHLEAMQSQKLKSKDKSLRISQISD